MSKHHVTITLGRTGQVVRRGGEGSSDDRTDNRQVSGSKRSIRDRLGSNAGSSSMSGNKRHRGDSNGWSLDSSGVDVGENDLRLKLMRKKLSQQMQSGGANQTRDLREKLSRRVQSPARDDENLRPEPREDRVSRQIASIRKAEHLVQGDSLRRSYSSVPMDSFRSRSPDRVMHSYRGTSPPRNMDRRVSPPRSMDRRVSPPRNMDRRVSPPRNMEELRRIPTRRPVEASRGSPPPRNVDELRQVPTRRVIDDSRHRLLPSNGVFESSRPMVNSSVTMQAPMGMSKPLTRMPPSIPPATNGIAPRSLYMGENVAELLHALGLGKYYINFQAEEVDMTALRQMGDVDLKDMGIPMGPRKKILLALMPRSKRPPP